MKLNNLYYMIIWSKSIIISCNAFKLNIFHKYLYHQHIRLYNNNDDKTNDKSSRPPIIPFDFAREDIIIPYDKTDKSQKNNIQDKKNVANTSINDKNNQQGPVLYDPRPTGYNTPDDGDEVDEELLMQSQNESINSLDSEVMKILKDIYIGTPYDSKNKKQARYIVRNITFISVLIGVVFTAIWYIFPGKFISFRGDTDFASRYTDTINYIEPSNSLLYDNNNIYQDSNDDNNRQLSKEEYFDDGIGLPMKEQTRFAPPPSESIRLAPSRTIDL